MEDDFAIVALAEVEQKGLVPDVLPPQPYVLVVDDEPAVADTLAAILRARRYAVTVAYDAESAIAIAAIAPPELLVSDFALPGKNGVELGLCLEVLVPDCKVIIITGVPHVATAFLTTSAAHFPVFAKPIQPAALLKSISELLPLPGACLSGEDQRYAISSHRTS